MIISNNEVSPSTPDKVQKYMCMCLSLLFSGRDIAEIPEPEADWKENLKFFVLI